MVDERPIGRRAGPFMARRAVPRLRIPRNCRCTQFFTVGAALPRIRSTGGWLRRPSKRVEVDCWKTLRRDLNFRPHRHALPRASCASASIASLCAWAACRRERWRFERFAQVPENFPDECRLGCNEISRMSPPQFGHSSGNSSSTRAMGFAHAIREGSRAPLRRQCLVRSPTSTSPCPIRSSRMMFAQSGSSHCNSAGLVLFPIRSQTT